MLIERASTPGSLSASADDRRATGSIRPAWREREESAILAAIAPAARQNATQTTLNGYL